MRLLTEQELEFVSGGHINGQGSPMLLTAGFFDDVGDALLGVAKVLWAAPTTAIGLAIGTAGFVGDHLFGDGNATISIQNGGIVFQNNPLMINGTALTLGNAQIYSGLGTDLIPGTNTTFFEHEAAHTAQAGLLGPFFLAVYFGGAMVAVFNGHDPFLSGNPLETGPYGNPPTPWP